ncbi:autoinducer binding domain-containing protein [Leisingera sp. M527]|uniref:autoinducer binding domain-containing protein n=1 Tax=Leisingera sp. M527 TaxID=2867014 RepID=UPI0021A9526F|nr:autoinducer binding domain-containing protein [Leisingera sp. M527]UWQ34602.1 autoinducer binding domain-containing protein [Leisingera sp. M527]
MTDSDWQQLRGELLAFGRRVSSDGFTAGFDFIGGIPAEIVTTFSEDWLAEYQERDYLMVDPVVIWGAQHDGVKSWSELSRLFPNVSPNVISIARERGMKHGTVVSMTVNRKKAIIGITHDALELSVEDLRALRGLLANMLIACPERQEEVLTMKGKKYISQVAEGMTDQEIANLEGRSVRAVAALRERVTEKLGVLTLPAAVLKAYKSRIID